MSKGALFIISAPSGAGKTSLVKALRTQLDGLAVSVSHTTRTRRQGEEDGRDYHFVSTDVFTDMVETGQFLEYAQVFDNFYGTARASVEEALSRKLDVILEIDWQGAQQIRKLMPACHSIFILPPSRRALEVRLSSRGQDEPETIARRMADAISEISHHDEFDYLVINDDFEEALFELRAIILSERLKGKRQADRHQDLITGLMA